MSLDAHAYALEQVYPPAGAPVRNASAWATEQVYQANGVSVRSAWAWATEQVYQPTVGTRNANAYPLENVISSANPTQIYYFDGTSWIRLPWYEWSGTTWAQIT